MSKDFLVTGCAGFIGMNLSRSLLRDGYTVVGLDNMNDYYDPNLKLRRVQALEAFKNFYFFKADISDSKLVNELFSNNKPNYVINLAAQAGVRYSLKNPHLYIESNIVGFLNILEASKNNNVKGLFYASSSSVYGGNTKMPFSEQDIVRKPISIYAASKLSNELMAFSYNSLYGLRTTGLRFLLPMGLGEGLIWLFIYSLII